MMYEIINPDSLFYSKNSKLVNDFMNFSSKNLGFSKPVTIDFIEDNSAGQDPLGKTAHYNPQEMSIVVYTTNRHPKDILRSLSHELIHHCQNCEERIPSNSSTEEGYAQTDETMRGLESEAYQKGNIMNFRDFEDQYKMKKNKKQINESEFDKKLAKIDAKSKKVHPNDFKNPEALKNKRLVNKARELRGRLARILNVKPEDTLDMSLGQLVKAAEFLSSDEDQPGAKPFDQDFESNDDAVTEPKLRASKKKAEDAKATRRKKKRSSLSRQQRQGPHIERLQRALLDFGMELKVHGADGRYGTETQRAINKVRRGYPNAPKRKGNFMDSVDEFTKWLEANKNIGRNVKPAPAKGPAPNSGSTNTALAKSADLSKEYDQLIADRRRIDGMAPGLLKREAERQHKAQLADFKKRRAAARGFGVNENVGPAFDQAEVSKKGEKRPLRENKKADRSEMLSRILTERLLGRNVKIKNN